MPFHLTATEKLCSTVRANLKTNQPTNKLRNLLVPKPYYWDCIEKLKQNRKTEDNIQRNKKYKSELSIEASEEGFLFE